MGFPERIRRKAREENDCCAVCRERMPPDAAWEVHSVTSLHLVRVATPAGPKFMVTDPPEGHEALRGRTVGLSAFPWNRESDAAVVCPPCHDEIKRIALNEARLRGFGGKAPPPQILEEVTLFFMLRGKPLSFDLIGTANSSVTD